MDYLYSVYDARQHQRSELRQECALIRKDMELLSTTMTVRLGSMLMLGPGLLFAALKLTWEKGFNPDRGIIR